jgi:hypothetical protein
MRLVHTEEVSRSIYNAIDGCGQEELDADRGRHAIIGCRNIRERRSTCDGISDPARLISEANRNPGSQTGSQRRQTPGDAGRHPATVSPASWHLRRHRETSRDVKIVPYKRGVTGSNPVAPTRLSQVEASLVAGKKSLPSW